MTAPPSVLPLRVEGMPAELVARDQWVCWKYTRRSAKDDWGKTPFNPNTDSMAKSNIPATWGTFDAACAAAGAYDGIGYVFAEDDPYCGIDLDDVRDPTTGALLPWAAELIGRLATFDDISPSATGVKLIVRGTIPPGVGNQSPVRADGSSVEMYDRTRYFCLTGHPLNEEADPPPIAECPDLAQLFADLVVGPAREERLRKEREKADARSRPTAEQESQESFESAWTLRATPTASKEERAAQYLRECPLAVQGQRGSNPTLWAARCAVWGFDLGEEAGLRVLKEHYNPRCVPPWSDALLRRKCREAARSDNGFAKPRGWLLAEPSTNRTGGAHAAPDGVPLAAAGADPEILSFTELMATEYPPLTWCVAGIIPEGLTMLCGKPKQGKSMMALNIAITVAGGGKALGNVPVSPGDVLYLALEDTWRRLQSRARRMLAAAGCGANERLKLAKAWPRQSEGGLAHIAKWIKSVPNPRLVIIDVWQKFRPLVKSGGQLYEQDSAHAGAVHELAKHFGVAVVVLHHTRKSEAEDVFDEISGSLGLAGAADTPMVLTRPRNENEATLHMTGRDVGERKVGLRFDEATFTWHNEGPIEKQEEGKVRKAVLEFLRSNPTAHFMPSEICEGAAAKPKLNPNSVRAACVRMANDGVIQKHGYKYSWPGPGSRPDPSEF